MFIVFLLYHTAHYYECLFLLQQRCILIEVQCHLSLQILQSGVAGLHLLQDGLVPHGGEVPGGGVDRAHAGVILLQSGHPLGTDIRLQSQQA